MIHTNPYISVELGIKEMTSLTKYNDTGDEYDAGCPLSKVEAHQVHEREEWEAAQKQYQRERSCKQEL